MIQKNVRLNFLVHSWVRKLFESLRERTWADSLTEVLRRAIAVFDWYVELYRRGGRLRAVMPDGSVEYGPDPGKPVREESHGR